MSMDGVFIHFLTCELNECLNGAKINKIYQPNPKDIILQLKAKSKTHQLFLSASFEAPRIYITNQTYENPNSPLNFCMVLRKHIERGIIRNISQYENDRIIMLTIDAYNEMSDKVAYTLIFEIMGRRSNIILVNEEFNIIDALTKILPNESNARYIIPHAKYNFPCQDGMLNPFKENCTLDNAQGISFPIKREITEYYSSDIFLFLNQKVTPTIFKKGDKTDFYCFLLKGYDSHLSFSSLSEMLEHYYNTYKLQLNSSNLDLIKQIKRLINHEQTKLSNLESDLEKAVDNLRFKDLGIILQANLYKVKKGMTSISLNNFLTDNSIVDISLDPTIDPSKNLKKIFTTGKKAQNATFFLAEQIEKTKDVLRYLQDLLLMTEFQTSSELEQIKDELSQMMPRFKNTKTKSKKKKIEIQHFTFEDVTIYIGKNSVQNDYLTNKLAHSNDYWFHVKDASGAHIVVSVPSNDPAFTLSEQTIRLASMIAAYYSGLKNSSSVPVDYTKIRYVKKISGLKGYNVTYTNQKTIYIDPSYDALIPYLRK